MEKAGSVSDSTVTVRCPETGHKRVKSDQKETRVAKVIADIELEPLTLCRCHTKQML
jgi:hypothetical protein